MQKSYVWKRNLHQANISSGHIIPKKLFHLIYSLLIKLSTEIFFSKKFNIKLFPGEKFQFKLNSFFFSFLVSMRSVLMQNISTDFKIYKHLKEEDM